MRRPTLESPDSLRSASSSTGDWSSFIHTSRRIRGRRSRWPLLTLTDGSKLKESMLRRCAKSPAKAKLPGGPYPPNPSWKVLETFCAENDPENDTPWMRVQRHRLFERDEDALCRHRARKSRVTKKRIWNRKKKSKSAEMVDSSFPSDIMSDVEVCGSHGCESVMTTFAPAALLELDAGHDWTPLAETEVVTAQWDPYDILFDPTTVTQIDDQISTSDPPIDPTLEIWCSNTISIPSPINWNDPDISKWVDWASAGYSTEENVAILQ